MGRIGLSVIAAFFLIAAARGAAAEEAVASATAESLFREAKDLMSQEKYPEACDKFEASYAIEETLGTLLNVANCHELEGRTATAWAEFLRAAGVARSAGQAEREKIARERASGLESKLMRLQIDVPDEARSEGLVLERDGTPVEEAAWGSAIPVDPGEHTIRASAPGKQAHEDQVEVVNEGSTVQYELSPLADAPKPEPPPEPATVPVAAAPAPEPAPPPPEQAPVERDTHVGSAQRALGLVVGAVGAAGLAGGSVFGVLAKNKWDDAEAEGCADGTCPTDKGQQASEDAKRFATFGTIGMAGGGALLLGGIVLYLTAPSAGGAHASSTIPRVGALVSRDGLSVELGGAF
jgi:hypothetical protein